MKVLHLLNTATFSGAENVACQIIKLMESNPSFEMVYCSRDGAIRTVLKENNIAFVPIKDLRPCELRKIIKTEKPDVIHAHDMRASFIAALACGKIPLISHIHNNAYDSRKISLKSIAYVYAAIKASHIFWVSHSSLENYLFSSFLKKKSTILHNIIDVDSIYEKVGFDSNEYDYDIVYVGRLTFQKDPYRLINVIRMVKAKNPNFRMAVIGTGELEEETKKLVKEYGLLDNVCFLGFKPNPFKILYNSKVMVMTSRWEGMPMCALEAMALGVPIVATPVDGLNQLIDDGDNGYLSSDDGELAQHICDILKNEKLYNNLSSNQINKCKILNDSEKYRDMMQAIYIDCCKNL